MKTIGLEAFFFVENFKIVIPLVEAFQILDGVLWLEQVGEFDKNSIFSLNEEFSKNLVFYVLFKIGILALNLK